MACYDCIERAVRPDWWELHGGPQLYFWGLAEQHAKAAQDGSPAFVKRKFLIFVGSIGENLRVRSEQRY
jgi:hypothetical protein